MSQEYATLTIKDQTYQLPLIEGTRGDKAIDIRSLLRQTGYITLDSGFSNTGSCTSAITYLDGANGILDYYGYAIEELAENCSFTEVAYLILHKELPTYDQLESFKHDMVRFALLHEDMIHFFDHFPPNASPMSILSTSVNALHNYYPEMDEELDPYGGYTVTAARLLSKIRTIAAFSYKKSIGHPLVYPSARLNYCENFLNMMFDRPNLPYRIRPEFASALNKLLILHADHEQNCSTSTVRLVGSSGCNLYASISAGISALWGPLHGGANQAVVKMLEAILHDGGDFRKYIEKAKDKNDPFRLSGFGHRVYKTFDPRAKIIKQSCAEIMNLLEINDPLLDIALELEEIARTDDYFVSRNLYPNVDFYSGIIYRAMGIPTNMFTVMFAMGRMPGWIAQWTEMVEDKENARIGRPRQVYAGNTRRPFVPMKDR
ncbi:citrate synthase [Desulforhopalus singaporensis]|uniref:Citrate synthase n=1 Tax=Desulforhopalus singaporensis TaxID=91360 RepID=A0A1H0R7L0_9BACT|nr:citrate synthase [Desulforhopalus singaporensis]SDP25484.1 citrate synthase [Desulforhopalus singaporensis]